MPNAVWQRMHKWLLRDIITGGIRSKATRGRKDRTCSVTPRRQKDMWRSSELQKIQVCGMQRDDESQKPAI